jgi:undecaprenyl-diphosphatase
MGNWDAALFHAINGLAGRSDLIDGIMLALARPSSLIFPAILGFGYWFWINRRQALVGAAVLGGLILFADLIGAQVKHLVERARPCWVLHGVHQLVGCGGTFSFPSNHAANTAAIAAFLQILYPQTGWVSWPLIVVIGFSRVYVGAHYMTDVAGGWVLGAVLGSGIALVLARRKVFRPTTARLAQRAPQA